MIVEAYQSGEPIRAIAAQWSISVQRVDQIARAAGAAYRHHRKPRKSRPYSPELYTLAQKDLAAAIADAKIDMRKPC